MIWDSNKVIIIYIIIIKYFENWEVTFQSSCMFSRFKSFSQISSGELLQAFELILTRHPSDEKRLNAYNFLFETPNGYVSHKIAHKGNLGENSKKRHYTRDTLRNNV